MRLPYQSDWLCRRQINAGEMPFADMHLANVAQVVWFGFLGKLDVAVIEVVGILPDGHDSVVVGRQQQDLAFDQADDHPRVNTLPKSRPRACTTSITARACRRTASRFR